ncbi:hypothetical protein BD770DRAFT_415248 [Pilaira anomala]|nr:hypothetical protein BD770DRAFT_415248 [Pilaira anomala]
MNVPKEIYLKIFQQLCQPDLKECSVVCKDWSLPALQRYYNRLTFKEQSLKRLIDVLSQEQYLQYCHWVNSLTFIQKATEEISEEKEEHYLTKKHLLKFLTYLPNLKSLELFSNFPKACYLESLLELNADKYLTQLEEIKIKDLSEFDSFDDLQCNVYYKFRASLKKLYISQEPESIIITKYGGIINYLNQFKKLTHLKYHNNTNQAFSVYQLQVACANLTILRLSDSSDILNYKAGNDAFFNVGNLQSLELSFPRMSASYAYMLIDNLPTKLNKLYIQVNQIGFYDWINLIGIEKVLKLAERMSKLSQAKILCQPGGFYETESEQEESELRMTLFFKILNAFKGDKKVFCTAVFCDNKLFNWKSMKYSKGILDFCYSIDYWDFGDNQKLVKPDKSITNIGLEIINQISFRMEVGSKHLQLLKYALINCPRLQFVEYIGVGSRGTEFYLSTTTGPFKQFNDSLTKTEENIRVIRLFNLVPSTKFLHVLATYLPNLSFFTCGIKSLFYHEKRPGRKILINLYEFKNLETFKLDMNLLSNETSESAYSWSLKINYTDGQKDLYQYSQEDYEIKLVPISSDTLVTAQKSSVVNILTINCKKAMRLVLFDWQLDKLIEINHGVP